jgi:hypothetical protein
MLAESSRWQISSGPQPTPLERQAEDHVEGEWIGGAPVRRPVEAKHKVAFHKVGFDRKPGFTVKAISLGRSTTVGTNSRSKYILRGAADCDRYRKRHPKNIGNRGHVAPRVSDKWKSETDVPAYRLVLCAG